MTRYPILWRFFGCYLNEDWPDEYTDEWAALADFVQESQGKVLSFLSEIDTLLAEHPSEDEVRRIVLDELRSCYLADVDGWKYRDWLKALADYAAKAVGHPQAS